MAETKTCIQCEKEISILDFHIANSKTGLRRRDCKYCRRETSSSWYESNKESRKKSVQEWKDRNKQKVISDNKKWVENNKDKVASYRRRWEKANPGKVMAKKLTRQYREKQAKPAWLTAEDVKKINQIYREARELSETTGEIFHVDHIIPLKGETVSGLHVPSNLQILSAEENLRKGNKLIITGGGLSLKQ